MVLLLPITDPPNLDSEMGGHAGPPGLVQASSGLMSTPAHRGSYSPSAPAVRESYPYRVGGSHVGHTAHRGSYPYRVESLHLRCVDGMAFSGRPAGPAHSVPCYVRPARGTCPPAGCSRPDDGERPPRRKKMRAQRPASAKRAPSPRLQTSPGADASDGHPISPQGGAFHAIGRRASAGLHGPDQTAVLSYYAISDSASTLRVGPLRIRLTWSEDQSCPRSVG
jgi:hypothetical protein